MYYYTSMDHGIRIYIDGRSIESTCDGSSSYVLYTFDKSQYMCIFIIMRLF